MRGFEVFNCDDLVAVYIGGKLDQIEYSEDLDCKLKPTAREFLATRVIPKDAWNEDTQKLYGIFRWNPYNICRKTHAYLDSDTLWVRFRDESLDVDWDYVQKQIW